MGINENTQIKITFVADKETRALLDSLVERRKRQGYKSSVSRLVNEIVINHIECHRLFTSYATPAASPNEG